MTLMVKLPGCLVVAGLALVSASACAKPQAKTAPEPVALAVPKVPERVVPPVPTVVAETEPEPDPQPEATAPVRRTPSRQPRSRTEPAKPVDAAAQAPAPEATPAPAAQGPLLRKPQSGDADEAVRRVRGMLDRASKDLGRVNYSALKGDTRLQYDSVKRFIEQAEEALRAKNLDIASFLADKAQTLARELFGQ